MNLSPESKKSLARWIIGIIAACTLIFLGVQNISAVAKAISWLAGLISPLVVGTAIALIINVPMRFFEAHIFAKSKKKILRKLRRPIAYIIALVLILGILTGIIVLVIPEIVDAIKVIVLAAMEYVNKLSVMSETEISQLPFGSVLLSADWDEILKTLQTWLKTQSGNIVNTAVGTVSSLVGGLFDFIIAFVFSIYILFNKDTLKSQIRRLIRAWIPHNTAEWIIHAVSVGNRNFRNFVSGQSLEAVILGVLCMIGMLILRIPYAGMVGALVGVTALIPVVGAFAGAVVGAFMILTESPVKAVIFVIFLIILQQLEGNLIYPKVMGNRVNMPAMWILAAVTIGGGIAGAVGMLLSVPVASTIYILAREATEKREKKIAIDAAINK